MAMVSAAALSAGPIAPAPAATLTAPRVDNGAVEAIVAIGNTVYVGGTFTSLTLPTGQTVSTSGLYAYNRVTGALDPGFDPVLSSAAVTSLAVAPDGQSVYVGGSFTSVNGKTQRRLARVNLQGDLITAFAPVVDARVDKIVPWGGRVFFGGAFTTVGGAPHARLAQVWASNGAPVSGFDLQITGSAALGGFVSVAGLDLSPDGSKLLVAHNGSAVGGAERYGLAVLDLGTTVTVNPWYTTFWKDQLPRTGGITRITDAQWGPDGTWFATSNTGGDLPPANDGIQRFEFTATAPVAPTWVTRQFDSTYALEIGRDGAVYVGGHFRYTEAPGSTDPFPGDASVNYGFGPAGGARVLGSQVVERGQLAALNPADGKALNWYHTVNGQHGITALAVLGTTLAVGHDGTMVDSVAKGRHGLVPTTDAPVDTTKPASTVSTPLMGAVLAPGTVTLRGVATAPAGVGSVTVEVKQAGKWLKPDGTLSTTFFAWSARVATTGATSTSWSLFVPLTLGKYQFLPRAVDVAKVKQPVLYPVPVEVVDTANTPPAITVLSPTLGQQDFTSRTITVSGTTSDVDGIAAVQLSFFNTTTQSFLTAPGVLGDFTTFSAALGTPAGTTTPWSFQVTLPDGAYTMNVNAVDKRGASLPRPVMWTFTMAPGNLAPRIAITSPVTAGAIGSTLTVKGSATDDVSVSRVLVLISDQRFARGPQPGGGFGAAAWLPATLAAPGAKTTGWSLTVANLPVGVYRITAYAQDATGVTTTLTSRPAVTDLQLRPAGSLTPEPSTGISGPSATTFRASTLRIPMTGTAAYAGGVARVKFAVRDVLSGEWLQPNGTMGPDLTFINQFVATYGATSTTWNVNLAVPYAGQWRVEVLAQGRDENIDWSPAGGRAIYLVYPGDADPTLEWNSPTDRAVMPGAQITAGGRAFDDLGVSKVQVLIVKASDPKVGLQISGALGVPEWIDAVATNPGGTATNWSYLSTTLPKGTWVMSVRAVDTVGKPMLVTPSRTVSTS